MASASSPRVRELILRAARDIETGALASAEAACREALRIDGRSADGWYLLAGVALKAGRNPEAEELARKAVSLDALHPGCWHTLGMAQAALGRVADSVESFRRAVQLAPRSSSVHNSLGVALRDAGDPGAAEESFRQAVATDARNAQAHHNLALLLAARGDNVAAMRHYEQATSLNPNLARSHCNLGRIYVDFGRRKEAEERFRKALALEPALPEANNNLGILMQDECRIEEALQLFDTAIRARPDFAEAHNNLALTCFQVGDRERARAEFHRAMQIDPDFAPAYWNLGNLEKDCGDLAEARRLTEDAVRRFPQVPMARYSQGLLDLLERRFETGWIEYTWREVLGKYEAHHPPRLPDGHCPPRPGGRVEAIDVVGEQGLGDQLFFARWAPRLRQRAGRITFHGDLRLRPMLLRSGAVDEVLSKDDWQHRAGALEVRVGDLPYFTGPAEPIPPPLPLQADPARLEAMRARLAAAGGPPYVGLTWRAGVKSPRGYDKLYKEVPLEAFFAAVGARKGTFVSLQREPVEAELALARERLGIADFGDVNADLEDALALLALLDDYIGVSNTNMHLRASLGLATRVLVPVPPEWRYGTSGEASPFFPAARLYRQAFDRGWEGALETLAADLA